MASFMRKERDKMKSIKKKSKLDRAMEKKPECNRCVMTRFESVDCVSLNIYNYAGHSPIHRACVRIQYTYILYIINYNVCV